MSPPITPNVSHGFPSFVAIAGMIVWNGRLPGSSLFAWFSSRANRHPRFCNPNPVPGAARPDPKPM
jgi:hypothetical protein